VTIRLENLEILLKLVLGDVARMGFRDAGKPLTMLALSE
jgi:hypothetical protein